MCVTYIRGCSFRKNKAKKINVHEHFQKLSSCGKEASEPAPNNGGANDAGFEELNKLFTIEEIIKLLIALKNGKAAGG